MFFKKLQSHLKRATLVLIIILNVPNVVHAYDGSYWTQNVNVFNFSCTDGDVDCWVDERNALDTLPLIMYEPLTVSEVNNKHHICVSFPHLKDSYWSCGLALYSWRDLYG